MLELAKSRRSIRKYTDEKISAEHRDKLLKAALLAPSSKGIYPVELIITEDRHTMLALEKCKTAGAGALKEAAMAIVFIADSVRADAWIEDASIAATYLMLEAETLGLGANWIQMRLRQGQNKSSEVEIRKLLNIPEHYGVLLVMAIGHKNERKQPKTDADIDFSKVHTDKF